MGAYVSKARVSKKGRQVDSAAGAVQVFLQRGDLRPHWRPPIFSPMMPGMSLSSRRHRRMRSFWKGVSAAFQLPGKATRWGSLESYTTRHSSALVSTCSRRPSQGPGRSDSRTISPQLLSESHSGAGLGCCVSPTATPPVRRKRSSAASTARILQVRKKAKRSLSFSNSERQTLVKRIAVK